ncbi:DUF7946 domain-containing protein [Alcaligenes aquatilis]|uniref:DUF7946 domain-containing protein n=1 Tax=Alcaligenes aquatilis TaxID=323284 RepID=UPI002AA7EE31|nr:hypothetical protein [Alcaligenes faecalis]
MAELKIRFKYEHGSADSGRLDLYDASIALKGISRSLAIITHAYLNGKVRKHGDHAEGARFYIETPKRGSFIYEATIFIAGSVSSGLFYDFIKHAFTEAVGKIDQEEDLSKALEKRVEPTIGELPAVLESSLQDMHRPIKKEHEITLTASRPRGEVLAYFDYETAEYLEPVTVDWPNVIEGNVTKYNALSGWGRFFDIQQGRTISFKMDVNAPDRERSLITWSLHENNMQRSGTLYLKAKAVVTPGGKIKRYLVEGVDNSPFI